MLAVMVVTGLFYLGIVRQIPADAPALAQAGPLIPYVIGVIVLSIIVQVVLAIASPKEAEVPADERERPLLDKAGHWSGVVLGVAVIHGALQYMWTGQGSVMFHWIVGGLILAQIAEYGLQILFLRRGY
ncbi:hypothetical protein E5222_13205 [Alteraurantiacibacter aquimixticola]|uniref:MFS transporter n=2 Tax=Alteraurantiacibacter aquimixticola TaxID=2489173 RepID=A0A4T3F357_9SPHN|nr:hypothetical protein E5222_13205 [Alteraurantiacibacter aquimixticola]